MINDIITIQNYICVQMSLDQSMRMMSINCVQASQKCLSLAEGLLKPSKAFEYTPVIT